MTLPLQCTGLKSPSLHVCYREPPSLPTLTLQALEGQKMAETAQPPTSSEGWSDCPLVRRLSFWQWQPGRSQTAAGFGGNRSSLTDPPHVANLHPTEEYNHCPGASSQGGCSNTSTDSVSQTCFHPTCSQAITLTTRSSSTCAVPGSMVGSQ